MDQPKHVNLATTDRLRIGLAFAVLECKTDTESVAAFILKLRRSRVVGDHKQGEVGNANPKPGDDHKRLADTHAKLLSRDLRAANVQVVNLEAEVRILKRKLAVTEIDLAGRTKALEDLKSSGASAPRPPAKKSKKATSAQGRDTSTLPSSPVKKTSLVATTSEQATNLSTRAVTAPSMSTIIKSTSASDDIPRAKETCGGNGTLITDGVDVAFSYSAGKNAVNANRGTNGERDPHVPYNNLPGDVTLLQTLLLPHSTSSTTSHQTAILEQALDVIAQISHILKLAFTSYSRIVQTAQKGRSDSPMSQADGEKHNQIRLADPARMIGLAENLVAKLLPPIMGRLGEEAVGRVVIAVAKGVIKPAIEAIRSSDVQEGHIPHPESGYTKVRDQMLQCASSLLDCLLQITPQDNSTFGALISEEYRPYLPFAEVVALWSTEALNACIRDVVLANQDREMSSTSGQPANVLDDTVTMVFVQLIVRCMAHIPVTPPTRSERQQSGKESNRENIIRHVKTRICNLITKLIADIVMQVESCVTESNALCAPDSTIVDAAEGEDSHAQDSLHPGKRTGPLWMKVGLKREVMLALCRLAEELMISEYCQGRSDKVVGSVYGWLEDLVGGR